MYNKERKTKYAIRKLAVATVSLVIGSVVAVPAIVDSGQVAHAEEQGVVAKKYKVEYQINNANYQDKRDIPAGLKALMPTDTKEYAKGETIRAIAPTQTTYVDSENDGVWTFKSYMEEEKVANDLMSHNRDTIVFHAVWEFKANTEYEESYEFLSGTLTRELPYEINNFKPKKLNKYGKGAKVNPQNAESYIYEVQDGFWVFSGWDQVEPNGIHSDHKMSGDLTGGNYVLFEKEDDIKFTGHWYFYAKDEIKGDKSKQLIFRRQFVTTKTDEYELPQEIIDLYTPMKLFRGDLDEITGVDKRDTIETPLGRWLRSGVGTSYGTLFDYSKGIGSSEGYNTYYQIVAEDYVWYFYPNIPSYTFVSGTSGVPLPTDIADAKPSGIILNNERREYGVNSDYKKGDIVKPLQPGESYNYIPATPKNIIYDRENKGLWRFQGYDKDSGIVGKDVLNFKGTWTFTPTKNPTITKVDNPAQLTQDEKDKVEKAVRDANPTFPAGTRMEVHANGDVEIIYPNQSPEKSIDTIPGTSTVAEKETSAKPTVDKVDTDDLKVTGTGVAGSKIEVTLPDGTTKKTTTVKPDGKWEVDLDNPLAKDGEVKVTQEETGKKVSPIAPTTVVPTTAEATTPNNPAVTKVDNPAQLTQDEKDKVVDEVKKANPSLPAGTTVTVDNNGDVTIIYPDKSKDTIPGTSTVAEKETSAKPTVDKVDTDDTKITGTGVAGSKIVVTLPNGDTKTTTVKPDGKWEVDLDNPLAKDGEVKVTQEETGKKVSPIAPTTVVPTTAEATTPKLPEVTEVDDPTQLTQTEKDKVVDEVKKANPGLPAGTTVTVDNNGDVTITYPDKSKDTIPGINTVVKKGHTPAPVVDKVDTDDTKITGEGVVGATVEVELPDGTKKTTVVKPDGKWEVPLDNPLPKDSVVKVTQTAPGKKVSEKVPVKVVETIADKTTPNVPAVTEVGNKTQLTQEEKGKVEKAVKDANPTFPAGTTVTVDNNGDVTITYPDKSKDTIPGTSTVVEKATTPKIADTTTPKLPEVTEVEDPTQLTQDEKDKVEDKVKKANPGLPVGTTVTVGNNGDVTITYPDKSKNTIPGIHTVVKKGTTPAPVVDKVDTDDTKITGEGVVGATVEVELPDGTKKTTVVKPDGKWEVPLANPLPKGSVVKATQTAPGKKVSEKVPTTVVSIADNTNPNVPTVTEVENKTKLTQGEKDKVVDEVKKANPGLPAGTTITVADNGDVTITYPDNSIDIIPGTKTVTEKTKVPGPAPKPTPQPQPGQKTIAEQITPKTPEVTEVGNKTKLTQGEKGKVEEAVKKANPGLPAGTKITVADNGEVTITYPDGSVDTIPGESTVKEKVKPAGEKAKAKTLPNTGLTANNAVVAGLSILAVAALLAARRKNNK